MSELIEVLSQTYQTLHRLSDIVGSSGGGASRALFADLELHLARIEGEAAILKQENVELHRHLSALETSDALAPRKMFPRPAQKTDVRQTMQVVSQFYQRYTREGQIRRAA